MAAETHRLSDQQWQIVLGSSDGRRERSRPNTRCDRSGTRFRMGHGARQVDYLDWKADPCSATSSQSRERQRPRARPSSTSPRCQSSSELRSRGLFRWTARSTCPEDYLKALTPLALRRLVHGRRHLHPSARRACNGPHRGRHRAGRDVRRGDELRAPECAAAWTTCATRTASRADVQPCGAPASMAVLRMFSTACLSRTSRPSWPRSWHPSMAYKLLPRYQRSRMRRPAAVQSTPVSPAGPGARARRARQARRPGRCA